MFEPMHSTPSSPGARSGSRPRRRLATLAIAAAFATASPLHAQAPAAAAAPEPIVQIVTNGHGQVRVTPDRATLNISVETRRPTASDASRENARLQRAVSDTLKAIGLTPDQLSTTDYSVMPEQRWNQQKQQSELIGYLVRNTIRVQVKQLDQLGKVIDAALGKGTNLVSSLDLFAANTESARRDALAKAVEQARADADVMAKAAGGSISGLLELSSDAGEPPVFQPVRMKMSAAAEGQSDTPIGTGSQELRVRVSARWRFQADRR